MKFLPIIAFVFVLFASCKNTNKQQDELNTSNQSNDSLSLVSMMDSCIQLVRSDDEFERVKGQFLAGSIVDYTLNDSTSNVSPDEFNDILTRLDTVINLWYVEDCGEGRNIFYHEVLCEDEYFCIGAGFLEDGSCTRVRIDFPQSASSSFIASFIDNPQLENDIKDIIHLQIQYDEEDDFKYAFLDDASSELMLTKDYLYLFFIDNADSIRTSRCSLRMFQEQYNSVYRKQ